MKKLNKVCLSFGRHGRYGNDTPIDRLSMLEAYLTGKQIAELLPVPEKVYHSPIARAVVTAKFRALGLGCHNLLQVEQLTEDAPTFTVRKFVNSLIADADENISHYHFVTHLPVVEKLGLPELGAGEIALCLSDNWQAMLADNFEVAVMQNPPIEKVSELIEKLKVSENDLATASAEEIYAKLMNFRA